VAARSPRLVSPRNRRSRTQGAGSLGELRVQFGDEFAGEVAAEGVEEGRGGGRTGQGRGSSGDVGDVGGWCEGWGRVVVGWGGERRECGGRGESDA